MPYQKLVTIYSPIERKILHSQGVWVDKNGNQIPVRGMSIDRLNKLVDLMAKWAFKEDNPYEYLRNRPIFPHVLLRIRELGLRTLNSFQFEIAYDQGVNHVLHYM